MSEENVVNMYGYEFNPLILTAAKRILNVPVQNCNSKSKISARPDLATKLLQILIPTTFDSLLCQKEQFTKQSRSRSWLVMKVFDYYPILAATRAQHGHKHSILVL